MFIHALKIYRCAEPLRRGYKRYVISGPKP